MRILSIPVLIAACAGCPDAFARDWYLGIAAGRAAFEGEAQLDFSSSTLIGVAQARLDGKDRAFATTLGTRLHPNVAVEITRYDLGKYSFQAAAAGRVINGSARVTGYGASLVGVFPVAAYDFYARGGYARTTLRTSGEDAAVRGRRRDNELVGAVGARWNFAADAGLYAEYQAHGKTDVKAGFAGLLARF